MLSSEKTIVTVPTGEALNHTSPITISIQKAIKANGGRIPFAQFMNESLNGKGGYYSSGTAKINGKESDFKTCTDFEGFNKTVGNSIQKVWEAMDEPPQFDIVEQGAGVGIMAKDMQVWAQEEHPKFYDALRYRIIEPGNMIAQQRRAVGRDIHHSYRNRALGKARNREHFEKVKWIRGSALHLPLGDAAINGVFVSNELPDAFPVEVVKKINGTLQQKYVGIEDNQWIEIWDDLSGPVQDYVFRHGITLENDGEEPINLHAEQYMREMDRALGRGATLTIDYGFNGVRDSNEKNFRAIRSYPRIEGTMADYHDHPDRYRQETRGERIHFIQLFAEYRRNPGQFDITADVDFRVLQETAQELGHTTHLQSQWDFLRHNGFEELSTPTEAQIAAVTDKDDAASMRWKRNKDIREVMSYTAFMALLTFKGIS